MISNEDVAVIARDFVTNWEPLRPFLGLSRQQQVEIRKSYPVDYAQQKVECLELWKEAKGNGATYGAFISAAEKANNQLLADGVRVMIGMDVPCQPAH